LKVKPIVLASIALGIMFLAPSFLVGITASDFTHCDPDEYAPWADGNDDGKIDIFDVVYVASKYSTNGCATKTLNITNWPEWYPVGNVNVTNFPTEKEPKTIVVCENYTIDGTGETIPLPFVVDLEDYERYGVFFSYLYQPINPSDSWLYACPKALNIKPQYGYGGTWRMALLNTGDDWVDYAYLHNIVMSPELVFRVKTDNQTSLSLTLLVYLYN